MELSKRLRAVADLVSPGLIIADVGTDHAYVPIQLVEEGRIPSAIAMDINEGPLLRAEKHIREHGLEHKIEAPKIQWTKRAESSGSTEHDRRRNGRRSYYPDTIGLP